MIFSLLSDKIDDAFRKVRGLATISEKNITDALAEIRIALLEADVDLQVTKDLLESIKAKAIGATVIKTVTPGQQMVKIFQDELVKVLGTDAVELKVGSTGRLLMVGLNGAGKTTTSAKLAGWLKKQGKRPLLVALDLYRPAAIEQLKVLAAQLQVPVFIPPAGATDPLVVLADALSWVEQQAGGVAIFDTAGRQDADEALLKELKAMAERIQPDETLLVVDGATGQQAVNVAKTFNQYVGITGLVMTKLDGDARGGALLSMRQVTGCAVKFLGMGEKVEQLEVFHPDRMAQRILGMGDVVSLVEKAADEIDEKEAEKMAQRFMQNKFDFTDFLNQIKFMRKLGSLEGLLGMLPGMGQMKKQMGAGMPDGKKIKHIEAIILSMTAKERKNPDLLNGSRRKRIAAGSGRSVMEVNQLMNQFQMMRQMMSGKGNLAAMASQMMGGGDMAKAMFPGGKMPGIPKVGGSGSSAPRGFGGFNSFNKFKR
jgi:signal recognition particle subunit SRP54